ncbi:MAG: AcrB/AcrD/AcrF family protein [Proteobacteria bacterium]|nr:MAG: AcrB/AcrD/AcrF family protein [Pseudomonadota bacterium]
MVISEICIRRPVFATVLSLLVLLVGLIAYDRLSVREYPNIDPPVVTVQTTYKGASAELIEAQVTQVIEESLAGIEGIDVMTSNNRSELSQITVNFKLNRDPDSAASDVRDRVSRVRGKLPAEIDEPVIQKTEADAQPIIYLAFSSSRHDAMEVTDYADRYVKERLQNLAGVAQVMIFGDRTYSMRLWLDPTRMAAYHVTPQDVENALRRQNVEVPAGRIESAQREFTVLSETDLRTPEQFANLILREEKGYLVRLKDVGRAELGPLNERRNVRFKGELAVALGVVKQATANPLDVSHAVRDELPTIIQTLPDGMQVEIAHDKSVFIEKSIENVYTTIAEAVVLVVLIIFLFLRSLRAVVIPMVTIPVSLIGAFAVMYAFGFTINTLTLLSLVLAIGLVVDDAIVMVENIFRHMENGEPRVRAAFAGSKEIGFAVLAMTLTLVAVYVPVGFMGGTTGKLFTEFAWTLAGAVLVSGFVALTLTPMMCSQLLRHQTQHGVVYRIIERSLSGITRGYQRLLTVGLRLRWLMVAVGIAVFAAGIPLYQQLAEELAPVEDQGTIFVVFLGPEGATLDYTDRYTRQGERIVARIPEVNRYFVVSGFPTVSQGLMFVKLVPWEERTRKQQEIAQELRGKLWGGIPGVMAFASNPPPLGQSVRSSPLDLVIQGSRPYSELAEYAEQIIAKGLEQPAFNNLDSDLKLNKPQLRITMDRDKVADMGLSVEEVGRTLETLFGGRQVTRFKLNSKQYDVMVQVADVDRADPQALSEVYVRGRQGEMVQLANLIRVEETVAPKELNHFNQMRSATITARSLNPGYTQGQAIQQLEAVAREILPPDVRIDYAGITREFKESSASLAITFLLALGFIYLVLAAQFESFVDPLIIMVTVPLAMTGALLALYLSGGTLNIYSKVGLVTLIGLITKHGILIVEFANQLQEQGRDKISAVIESAVLRLRPILMTTGAMTLGAVPLAIATGAGAESRQQIGWVIVGGILVGTFFTLFVIPAVYTLMARRRIAKSESVATSTAVESS